MFFRQKNAGSSLAMTEAMEDLERDPSILLIDVRTNEEYRAGHIPGSRNLPMDRLSDIVRMVPDKETRLFAYCLSGNRSRIACAQLKLLGYSNATNIGGITQWPGDLEKSESI